MSEAPKYPIEDQRELKRFQTRIKNMYLAMDVQIPDERFLTPHKDYQHYDIHVTEPTGMTIIDSFYFKTREGIMAAIKHTKSLLPDERENSSITEKDVQATGDALEEAQKSVESDSASGESKSA